MPGTPVSEYSGSDSYEFTKASLYITLHRLESLLSALDVDRGRQPGLRIDDQEAPA